MQIKALHYSTHTYILILAPVYIIILDMVLQMPLTNYKVIDEIPQVYGSPLQECIQYTHTPNLK